MNVEKLKRLQAQVRIGGKGTPRRKKKVMHQSAATDDKKLQSSLKKLSVSTIPGIEEVNIIKDDLTVIHFNNPKAQASLSANTFAVTGHGEMKKIVEMLPEILPQLGQETVVQLRMFANSMSNNQNQSSNVAETNVLGRVVEEDEVPMLVGDFDEVAKLEAIDAKKLLNAKEINKENQQLQTLLQPQPIAEKKETDTIDGGLLSKEKEVIEESKKNILDETKTSKNEKQMNLNITEEDSHPKSKDKNQSKDGKKSKKQEKQGNKSKEESQVIKGNGEAEKNVQLEKQTKNLHPAQKENEKETKISESETPTSKKDIEKSNKKSEKPKQKPNKEEKVTSKDAKLINKELNVESKPATDNQTKKVESTKPKENKKNAIKKDNVEQKVVASMESLEESKAEDKSSKENIVPSAEIKPNESPSDLKLPQEPSSAGSIEINIEKITSTAVSEQSNPPTETKQVKNNTDDKVVSTDKVEGSATKIESVEGTDVKSAGSLPSVETKKVEGDAEQKSVPIEENKPLTDVKIEGEKPAEPIQATVSDVKSVEVVQQIAEQTAVLLAKPEKEINIEQLQQAVEEKSIETAEKLKEAKKIDQTGVTENSKEEIVLKSKQEEIAVSTLELPEKSIENEEKLQDIKLEKIEVKAVEKPNEENKQIPSSKEIENQSFIKTEAQVTETPISNSLALKEEKPLPSEKEEKPAKIENVGEVSLVVDQKEGKAEKSSNIATNKTIEQCPQTEPQLNKVETEKPVTTVEESREKKFDEISLAAVVAADQPRSTEKETSTPSDKIDIKSKPVDSGSQQKGTVTKQMPNKKTPPPQNAGKQQSKPVPAGASGGVKGLPTENVKKTDNSKSKTALPSKPQQQNVKSTPTTPTKTPDKQVSTPKPVNTSKPTTPTKSPQTQPKKTTTPTAGAKKDDSNQPPAQDGSNKLPSPTKQQSEVAPTNKPKQSNSAANSRPGNVKSTPPTGVKQPTPSKPNDPAATAGKE